MRRIQWPAVVAAVVLLVLGSRAFAADTWLTSYPAAQAQAKKEGKLILLSFGGSDWCPPCIIMRKRVFDSDVFKAYAEKNLVTVDLDFPQGKVLPEALQKQNLALAAKYDLTNPETGDIATVPVLVLTTPGGSPVAIKKEAFFYPSDFLQWAKEGAERAKRGA